MKILFQRTPDMFFKLGSEDKIISEPMSLITLSQKYNIELAQSTKKLINIKRRTKLKDDTNIPVITCFSKNLKDAVETKINTYDLINESQDNIERMLIVEDNEMIIIPFDGVPNKRIVITF